MKSIIEILKNYKFVKKDFFLMLFSWLLLEMVILVYPKLSQYMIQVIEERWTMEELYYWWIIFSIYTIIFLIIRIISNYYWIRTWLNLFSKKQLYYQKIIIEKNYKDILDLWTGKLLTRLESWTSWEVDIFSSITNIFITAVFRWILIIVILSFNVSQLIFIILWWIIILTISNYYLRKYINKYTKEEQKCWEEFGRNKARIVMENLIIKIFGKKELELEKSKNILDKATRYGIKVDTANELYYKVLEWVLRFIEIITYLILWSIIINEWTYPISYLIMIIWYVWFLRDPIDKAISNLNRINRVWEKYEKLKKFINKPDDIKNWEKEYIYKNWKIEFKDFSFEYNEERKIFENLNLKILEGKKNALIGHSWWGKSTIIKLILRLYEYQKWEILIDGQDLRSLNISTLYKHIWYLPQDPAIFDGTIRENLEYAFDSTKNNENAGIQNISTEILLNPFLKGGSDNLLWEALKKAQVDDLIKWLEKWLDTEVWEKWIKLSWGEKQRLAIARIFLKNPEIIILDEPTSALDSISEAKITETLNELMKDKTSIIIAHRLQTVMNADQIVIIEWWEITDMGKHKELLKKSKTYKELVDLQHGKIVE